MIRTILTLFAVALCAAQQLRGVNYGIQRPDGSCTNYDQVLADFQIMATFAQAVKIYNMGFCTGAQNSLIAARATGLKLFLGMAAGPPDAFQNELNILKTLGSQYGFANVIGITVGSEDLYRQSVAAETIAGYIQQVQAALKTLGATVPVTHTDVYYLQPASILNVEDIVMMNAFSFWEGQNIDNALNTFISHYEALKSQAGGKTVWIGESGWPAAGTTQAGAVASPQNAGTYVQQFVCWANANGVPYFYFEAFDEPWKGSDPNGAIEVSFGLYNSDRTRKSYFNFQCPGSGSSTTSNNNNTPSTTPAVDCKAVFSTLSCTTSSEDPSQVDASQVNNAQGWLCSNYPQYCADIVSGGKYSSCNSVEKISYAMSQYYNANGPSADACSFGGLGHVTGNSAASANNQQAATSSNAPAASTSSQAAAASTTSKAVAASTTSQAAPSTSGQASSGNTCQTASFCSAGLCACGGACYNASQYCCPNGQLTQKQFC